MLLEEPGNLPRILMTDRDELYILSFVARSEFIRVRNVSYARSAPRAPEIKHDHFAVQGFPAYLAGARTLHHVFELKSRSGVARPQCIWRNAFELLARQQPREYRVDRDYTKLSNSAFGNGHVAASLGSDEHR